MDWHSNDVFYIWWRKVVVYVGVVFSDMLWHIVSFLNNKNTIRMYISPWFDSIYIRGIWYYETGTVISLGFRFEVEHMPLIYLMRESHDTWIIIYGFTVCREVRWYITNSFIRTFLCARPATMLPSLISLTINTQIWFCFHTGFGFLESDEEYGAFITSIDFILCSCCFAHWEEQMSVPKLHNMNRQINILSHFPHIF